MTDNLRSTTVQIGRIGRVTLRGFLALGLSITLFLAWKSPTLLPYLPIVLLGGVLSWHLFRHPLLNLCVVLAGFVVIADFEEGIQFSEILYGLYYVGFLSHWFISRIFLFGDKIFERREDRILVLFLVLTLLSLLITLLFGGSLNIAAREWLSLSFLAFYFPVREAIERNPRGLHAMLGVIVFVGLFVLARNVLHYENIIQKAAYAWQVVKGRSVANEGLLMVPAIFSIVFFLYSGSLLRRLISAGLFISFFGGLILTQSRGYWVAFLIGSLIIFYYVPNRMRIKLVTVGFLSALGIIVVGYLFVGDYFLLILSGLLSRFLTLGSAVTTDISLVNRFLETAAVWEHIKDNPILGYGMGTSYRVFDITLNYTFEKTFIHNGYIALWFKFGIWGLSLMLLFLGNIFRRSVRVFRSHTTHHLEQIVALGVAASFLAFFFSALTSNPFYINDTMFMYGVLAGIIGGCFVPEKDARRDVWLSQN